jgi:1-acyl-sn-glycerol-3-phosphate acyltransferase
MIVDPAVLSVTFKNERRLHYWAKDSMFKNPYAKAFLTDCGVVPVDRTTKNNSQLYASTFEVLKLGEAVAVFPEGTSHTLPNLSKFKDGTSFVNHLSAFFLLWLLTIES